MLGVFERAAELGDVVRIELPFRTGYAVGHPDGVRHVLVDNHKNYGKNTRGYRMLSIALGQGLVTSQGELWRRQRRIAQPAFHHQRISRFLETMDAASTRAIERWRGQVAPGETLEIDAEMMRLTLEIVGRCLMSTDLTDASDAVAEAMAVVLAETVWRLTRPLALPLRIPTRRNLRLQSALARMRRLVGRIIEARRASPEEAHDLLAMFMEARDEDTGEGMTDRQLQDEIMTMVSAGHETTANALTWALHFLTENPEARARLEAEVDDVLGEGAPLDLEALGRLEYTEATLKESMRLRPPVWLLARSAEGDDEILGHDIPAGSMVFLPQWTLHRDPRFWSEPERFEPERFLGANAKTISKHLYFPFAGGPRVCIGQAFALMEGKVILAHLARAARFSAPEGQPAPVPDPTITLRPRGGLPLRVAWRGGPC
jgi:cytochrome P450